jgi:hypothetical protein
MDIPLMVDSDDADSLAMSDETSIMHDVPNVRTAPDTNIPIDVDLYLDELFVEDPEPESEPEPELELEPEPERKPVPKSIPRAKATTIENLEDELVECVINDCSAFHTLYMLHEHFANSKAMTSNERASVKSRILNKLAGNVSNEKQNEFRKVLNNFFK